jgi:undecaprenyl-diphosphatase
MQVSCFFKRNFDRDMSVFPSFQFISSLDNGLVTYLNSFARRSWTTDEFICVLNSANVLKGSLVMTAYWWAWFRTPGNRAEADSRNHRDTLLYTLFICIPAVRIARLMALFLPFRPRPLFNPDLHLRLAFTLAPDTLLTWSSFPSDHAVLFFALATGLYLVSRRMGWLMYLYTIVFILLPRVYLGIHYPSDILAGALLGVAAASTARAPSLRWVINWPAQRLLEYSPGLFYAFFFQLSYQTVVLYEPMRNFGSYACRILRILTNRL